MIFTLIRVFILAQLWVACQASLEFWSGSQKVHSLPHARDEFLRYLESYDRSKSDASGRMLFIFDHDDTLTSNGAGGENPESKFELLNVLTANAKHDVWIISGRGLGYVREIYADVKGLNIAGEYGQVVLRAGQTEPELLDETEALNLRKDVEKIAADAGLTSPVDYIKLLKFVAFICHKQVETTKLIPTLERRVKKHYNKLSVQARPNPENSDQLIVSIRDRTLNKGQLVERLLGERKYGFALIAGDHRIDEEMFLVAKHFHEKTLMPYFTIVVGREGEKLTHAIHKLENPGELLQFLQKFLVENKMLDV